MSPEQNDNAPDPALWQQLMADSDEAFTAAEVFEGGIGWKPSPGKYRVIITDVRTGVFSPRAEPDRKVAYWAPKGQILGALEDTNDLDSAGNSIVDRKFDLEFLTTQTEVKFGILKKWAQTLADGQTVNDIRVADSLLQAASGTIVDVTVAKSGQYTNVYLDAKVNLDAPAPQV